MRKEIRDLSRTMTPRMRRAFLDSVASIKSSVRINRLVELIKSGNIDAVIEYVAANAADFAAVTALQQQVYNSAGLIYASNIHVRGSNIRFGWDMTHGIAARRAEKISATLVTREVESVKQAIRTYMVEALERGMGPRNIALDLSGRIVQGRRQGGVIGLADQQAQWVANFRHYLDTNDPRALGMSLRDRRFDATIRKGNLTQDQIDKLVSRYSDRLLRHRAENIARTEMAKAMESANEVAFDQAIDRAGVPLEATYRIWHHGGGGLNPRDSHRSLNGEKRYGNETFTSVVGNSSAEMLYPHQEGVGPEHVVNCTCTVSRGIDYSKWQPEE